MFSRYKKSDAKPGPAVAEKAAKAEAKKAAPAPAPAAAPSVTSAAKKVMRRPVAENPTQGTPEADTDRIDVGQRNDTLWRACMATYARTAWT